ncbi:MAG: spermidine synthase [Actinomycetes bacterium]
MPGRPDVRLLSDRSRARAYTLRVGGADQSYVDLDDPRRLEFDYVARLADALDVWAPAGQRLAVAHLGGAGLTLPRYLAATRPSSAQVVFEPDRELTAFVRTHLPLPARSGIKIREIDGRSGVAALRESYADAVVIDAFAGSRVPAELTTAALFADVRRVLRRPGLLLVNLTDRGPFAYGRRVLAGVGLSFPHVALATEPATLRGRRFGNAVIVASDVPLPVVPLADAVGRPPFPYRVLHGARLAQLLAGAAPYGPDDAEPSPEPPRDFFRP